MRRYRLISRLLGTLLALALAAAPVIAADPAPTQNSPAPTGPRTPTPTEVKGIYITAWHAGDPAKLGELLALIDRTELNAVVVDVKDDSGRITFATSEATARQAGAIQPFIADPKAFTDDLKARGIYTIARIVTFKDPIVAPAHPDWATLDAAGKVWRDYNGVAWLDPHNREAWAYLLRIARSAEEAGFDEIQFDYVRFPTDGDLSAARYPAADGRSPQRVIADFLAYARAELKPLGVPVSADVFGLVTSAWDDMGIGQQLEALAGAVDFVSPMLYPSHYERGNLGLANPNAMPYDTVYRSLVDAQKRIAQAGLTEQTAVRPWLQDFSWGHPYGPDEVRGQIQATYDAGYTGWLLWNQANDYTEAALLTGDPMPAYILLAQDIDKPVAVELNGQQMRFQDVHPFVTRKTWRTLIPLRAVSEALGADVDWDDASQTASIRLRGRLVQVALGEEQALVNGVPVELSQPAVVWQGRILVPLRFLAEGFGAEVAWDEPTGRVLITLTGVTCQPGYCGE